MPRDLPSWVLACGSRGALRGTTGTGRARVIRWAARLAALVAAREHRVGTCSDQRQNCKADDGTTHVHPPFYTCRSRVVSAPFKPPSASCPLPVWTHVRTHVSM